MENAVRPISSIICFNSGSAGDLLVSLCCSQLDMDIASSLNLTEDGAVNLGDQYFKEITKEIFYQHKKQSDIDFARVKPIENTHYYLNFYTSIAENTYFIDYPDHYKLKILEAVKKKRYNNSWSVFLELNREFLPEFARQKVTVQDVPDIFAKRWHKNLVGWRSNPNMTAINFLDFFDTASMKKIVEIITKTPISSEQKFLEVYRPWLEKNQDFFKIE